MKVLSTITVLAMACLAPGLLAVPSSQTMGFNSNVDQWKIGEYLLSIPRSRIAATSVGSKALFAGGYLESNSYTPAVDIFDHNANKWSTAKLSSARSSIGSGSFAGRYALFAGGFDDKFKPVATVDVYDALTDKWSVINLSVPRGSPGIIDLGDRAAIVGGLSVDLNYLSKAVDFIDLHMKITTSTNPVDKPQLGVPMSDLTTGWGMVTSNYQNNNPGNKFNDFQPSSQTVLFKSDGSIFLGPSFPAPRFHDTGAGTNGLFAVGGGTVFGNDGSSTNSNRVDLYCQEEQSWCGELGLSEARPYPNTNAMGNKYIVFAGGDNSKAFDILDTSSRKWVEHSSNIQLRTQRIDASSTVVNNCLLLVAGGVVSGQQSTASVELFNACL